MAADPRKRQKKLARRAARSKTKHLMVVREKSRGMSGTLAEAADCPILESLASDSLRHAGMGHVTLSRALPSGLIACAMFLVDRHCLGVKNVMLRITSRFDYRSLRSESDAMDRSRPITPATARRFVESAVEYAGQFGFRPHADYQQAKLIFGSIDPAEATEELEFGKDGKPMFCPGPFENQARCRAILAALERTCGPEGYTFLMPIDAEDDDDMFAPLLTDDR